MDVVTGLASAIGALAGILTAIKTILEIRKLLRGEDEKSKRRIAKTAQTAVGFLAVLLFIALGWSWSLATQKEDLSTQNTKIEQNKISAEKEAQANLERAERLQKELAESRRRSIDEFARIYQDLMQRADEAVTKYRRFDTATNRSELGDRFQSRQKELLEDVRVKMQALIDHVEKWKPVAEALAAAVNGRVRSLNDALRAEDYAGAFRNLAVLKETYGSDITRLRSYLDSGSKTGTK